MSALPLAELQRLFQGQVLSGASESAGPMQELVAADARGSADERIGVYIDACRLRLTEALASDYPALRAALGQPGFERLCRLYIAAHPSTTPSIRWLGRHMAGFLSATREYAARPALAELALFEWQQGETFDAEDAASITIAEIAAIPPASWPGMRLRLHPSVRRLNLRTNAPLIVRAVLAGIRRPPARQSLRAKHWLMWRDAALDIRWRRIAADEAAALDAIVENRNFAELCERLCAFIEPDQAAIHAASLLKRWIEDGLISGFELAG